MAAGVDTDGPARVSYVGSNRRPTEQGATPSRARSLHHGVSLFRSCVFSFLRLVVVSCCSRSGCVQVRGVLPRVGESHRPSGGILGEKIKTHCGEMRPQSGKDVSGPQPAIITTCSRHMGTARSVSSDDGLLVRLTVLLLDDLSLWLSAHGKLE